MTLKITLKEIEAIVPSGTKILAVSKGQSVNAIRDLALEGHYAFGESKLQEALLKINHLKEFQEIQWHFIGKVQSNKVRQIVCNFDFIHSADSLKLIERISRIAAEEGKTPNLMAQVKFRPDENKSGFLEKDLLSVWNQLIVLPNINIIGLMTILPFNLPLAERAIVFKECRDLADKLNLTHCSMGMSRDWKEALAAGSTWLRLGSALFGKREQ